VIAVARPAVVLRPVRRTVTPLDRFVRNRRAIVGGAIVLLLAAMALLAPLIAPYEPDTQNMTDRFAAPSSAHLLGTDNFGRDILSRCLFAGRVSLSIGVISVLLSIVFSVMIGSVAGFYGGNLDNVLMRFTDMMLAFPTLFLLFTIVALFGNDVPVLIAVLGLTSWQVNARVVRGELLSLKVRDFVTAARCIGAGDRRLVVQHLLPNVVGVVVVGATIRVALNILLEAGLSYLGLGVQPPIASWGNMVSDGKTVLRTAWWVTSFPGAFIFLTVMAFNLLGDGLRDAFDPRMDT
jgi:peptide/nickel transport system permease protein